MSTSRAVRHDYTIATTATFADQRIARINTAGVVTQSVVGRLLADCQADVARLGAHALVADYSAATLALDPAAVMASVTAAIKGGSGALALPTVLLVTPETLEFWDCYAWMMVQAGIVRGVVTSQVEAQQWAREKAPVYCAQLQRSALQAR